LTLKKDIINAYSNIANGRDGIMASAFITGAGGGIAGTLVRQALAQGDFVIAGVLNAAEQASLPQHPSLQSVIIDVGSTESVTAAFAQLDTLLGGRILDAVVHCAGICPTNAVEVQTPEVLAAALNVNVVGSVRVLRESMPRLRGHGGRILLFSSLWGKVGGPMLSAYCASKHAIEAIADSARRETKGQNFDIVVIEPGVILTGMANAQGAAARRAEAELPEANKAVYATLYSKFTNMIERTDKNGTSAEDCAKQLLAILATPKPKSRYPIGKDAKALTFMARILPDAALDKLFKSMMKM